MDVKNNYYNGDDEEEEEMVDVNKNLPISRQSGLNYQELLNINEIYTRQLSKLSKNNDRLKKQKFPFHIMI